MADIIGSAQDTARIRAIEKQREEKRKEFEKQKEKMKAEAASGLKKIGAIKVRFRLCTFKFSFSSFVLFDTCLIFVSNRFLVPDQRFSSNDSSMEAQFKAATVGLVSAEEYTKKRMELELAAAQNKKAAVATYVFFELSQILLEEWITYLSHPSRCDLSCLLRIRHHQR